MHVCFENESQLTSADACSCSLPLPICHVTVAVSFGHINDPGVQGEMDCLSTAVLLSYICHAAPILYC